MIDYLSTGYRHQGADIGDQGKIETDTLPLIPVNRHKIINPQGGGEDGR